MTVRLDIEAIFLEVAVSEISTTFELQEVQGRDETLAVMLTAEVNNSENSNANS